MDISDVDCDVREVGYRMIVEGLLAEYQEAVRVAPEYASKLALRRRFEKELQARVAGTNMEDLVNFNELRMDSKT